jgi:hypothetical protein
LSSTENNDKHKLICQHCLSSIDEESDRYFCKSCGMVYHIKCWEKGNGCAVLSCSQRNILLNPLFQSSVPVRELLIHIEYLFNVRKFNEAINECNRILNVDKNNTEAKVFYNRAISMMNIKMKIYESAEESFKKKEFKAASMFYSDYLKYCDDEENEFIHSKIKYLNELLPAIKRNRYILNSIYTFIFALIILSAGFLAYRFIYLKENTEFAEIEAYDDLSDIKILESQISKYEKFLIKYPEGKLKELAAEKIRKLSALIAISISNDDWRTSFIYLKKIDSKDNPITYKDIYGKILSSAKKEFQSLKSEARYMNENKKFNESKDKIDKSLALLDNFPSDEFVKERQAMYDSKNLINKKLGLVIKAKDIENEISNKTEELKKIEPELDVKNMTQILGKVMKKSREYVIIKSSEDKKLYAIKNANSNYEIGEEVIISGLKKGKADISDDAGNLMLLPVIYDYSSSPFLTGNDDKNIIIQRLNLLKEQKEKIDSLLKIGI